MKTYSINIENKVGEIISNFTVNAKNIKEALYFGQKSREFKGKLTARLLK